MSRLALLAGLLILLGGGACLDANLAEPEPGSGGVILFASNRADPSDYELYRVGGDGAGLRRLTQDAHHNDMAPALSPGGAQIAWERELASPSGGIEAVEIWVMGVTGESPRVVVSNGSFNRAPAWLDAATLVYSSFVSGNWEIYRVGLGDTEPVNLSRHPLADQHPRPAPDGATIAFHSNRDFNFEVYLMDRDGSAQRNLTRSADTDDRFPGWGPDGRQVYWSRGTTTADIYMIGADGSDPQAVIVTPYSEFNPSVSPDGRRIVFQTDQSPPFGLFLARLGIGEMRPLLSPAPRQGSDLQPSWYP